MENDWHVFLLVAYINIYKAHCGDYWDYFNILCPNFGDEIHLQICFTHQPSFARFTAITTQNYNTPTYLSIKHTQQKPQRETWTLLVQSHPSHMHEYHSIMVLIHHTCTNAGLMEMDEDGEITLTFTFICEL